MQQAVQLASSLVADLPPWQEKVLGRYNGNQLMLVRAEGAYHWHTHHDSDDFFLVISGRLRIDMPDSTVVLGSGDMFVVPKGVEHRPVAEPEACFLLMEPVGSSGPTVSNEELR